MDNKTILNNVNESLSKQFGAKHKVITMQDIEKTYKRNVLSVNADAKTVKGMKKGYLTGVMYLSPCKLSGFQVCPNASKGCKKACLYTAGRGRFYSVTRARIIKTIALFFDDKRFYETVKRSIKTLETKAKNKGLTPCVRLNGTSDILSDKMLQVVKDTPHIQYYDYTKVSVRFNEALPTNYHLTLSLSESNETAARSVLANGGNVAAVFRKTLPATLWGYRVVNGDLNDLRFMDDKNVIVGLKAKGEAKKDTSGFVKG